ncbi:Biopolymer transport protein ExbB [compost metagenome]|jgi:biopolymer transport protein ExbB|uniref:Biopolymer transport protein ExbB n=1 Tax=Agrobacterium radiobacter TaxID=362 RepID=A0ABD5LCT0_AGRRD|nr:MULTISPECIES: tonB-system energizer ExbB [Agrobacterium tumefaciens complex]MCP2133235.1 biopolymer transport protein ExbB [Rhizobium sp. SLBN-94]KWT77224.1 biopolymer transporter ExbB [Agrobacterium radiobacter]MBB4333436.1 biopolymer transport protein ExbB [Agrobacterium radiobacter]MBB4490471.1 biopolymer transport protein ExbB [Agrobacterium radiobacter]MBB4495749.1 biopolymer transport protein ExbB [Agrobacterium radiobacter]
MSAETSTSSASFNRANTTRHLSLAMAVTLLAGLSAGAVFAQTASETQIQPAPQTEAAQPAQPAAPAAPSAPATAPVQPSATAPEQPAASAPSQPPSTEPAQAQPAPTQPATDTAPQPAQTNQTAEPNEAATPIEPVSAAPASAEHRADIPHNLSPWGMFMAADWVVKGVMIGLAFASLVTWTVWVAKSIELAGARVRAGATLKVIRRAKTLNEATEAVEKKGGPAALMLRMATHEMQLSDAVVEHTDGGGIKERVSSALSRIETHAGRRMSRGTGVLATIGSTAPFVGLFGTVWGIMNSFISISESQTTNLAVVAPGIAEALLATAIGLVAAIPAVVIYNVFARSITGYRHLLADAAAGVERLVSRDLDFRRIPPGSASKPAVSLVGR